jgi:hypothetical protein
LLDINVLDIFCREPLEVGENLCLPPPCATYEIKEGDSCESILRANTNVTWAQLSAWNPNFNSDCSNIRWYTGFDICLRYVSLDTSTLESRPELIRSYF